MENLFNENEKIVLKHWRDGSKIAQYREDLPNTSDDEILKILRSVMDRFFERYNPK